MRSRLRASIAAPAYPIRCTPGDNLAIHVAVTTAPEGSVLVVDVGDVAELGYWGEVLTTAAEARGIVGLVIDGGVRDVAALAAHGFPVFSTQIALRGATKQEPGSVGDTARVGGVEVGVGDWIVADGDGVTVVPVDALEHVLVAGRARADKEDTIFAALRSGQTTVELLDLDPSPIDVAVVPPTPKESR
jgi:4-hydroxy-4-methyl-2-oxoglutarate aldolase